MPKVRPFPFHLMKWIPFILWDQLTETQKQEFGFLDTQEKQNGASFFSFSGEVYYLGDFFPTSGTLKSRGFDFIHCGTYFTGVAIKVDTEGEGVKASHVRV